MLLNILSNFCDYWWLAWCIPFFMGLSLGYFIWAKFAKRVRLLEDEIIKLKLQLKNK